jgi:hypothetical protein
VRQVRIAACVAVALLVGAFAWLKAEHRPDEAIEVATSFLQHVEAKRFAQAHELTTKSAIVGRTPEDLRSSGSREVCHTDRSAWSSPTQSNGNRLRRILAGREVEPPEVRVEFEGHACLLGVFLRLDDVGRWRVSRVASHAG